MIAYAEKYGNRAAGREFSLGESNVRMWRKQKDKLLRTPSTKCAARGRPVWYPEIERDTLVWFNERRKENGRVTAEEIRLKARQIGRTKYKCKGFKASSSWCYTFMKRYNAPLKSIPQKKPNLESEMVKFKKFMAEVYEQGDYDLSQIGNADKIDLVFDIPRGNHKKESVNTMNKRIKCSLLLACTADGSKLPPYVVFKRKTLPLQRYVKVVIVRCQKNGSLNEQLFGDWTKIAWGKRPGSAENTRSLLVMDAQQWGHLGSLSEKFLDQQKTTLALIPQGMPNTLQPLDGFIKNQVKVMLRHKMSEWQTEQEGETESKSAGARNDEVKLNQISQWIGEVWSKIKSEVIVHSFRRFFSSLSASNDELESNNRNQDNSDDDAEIISLSEYDEEDDDEEDENVPQHILDIFLNDTEDFEFEGFEPIDCV